MRKLASIQRIKSLEPIEGADSIEKATVLGWQLVVKKGEFKVGDLAIYIEIDSVLPERPEFEFVRARSTRVKTIRLRGQVSQGICFPTTLLPLDFEIVEGTDCTEILGITKYEPPLPANLSGIAKGKFPSFIPKTDEVRVQVLQELIDSHAGENCYITEKVDGTSVTYYFKDGVFGVCSRNLELIKDDENSYWKMATALNLEEKLKSLGRNLALQGELVGENIQSNKLNLRGQDVMFFNAFDIDSFEYINFEEFENIINSLDLRMVPIIDRNFTLTNSIESLIKLATRKSVVNPQAWAEGIIIRSITKKIHKSIEPSLYNAGRLSFKVINPEFLLKYGE